MAFIEDSAKDGNVADAVIVVLSNSALIGVTNWQ